MVLKDLISKNKILLDLLKNVSEKIVFESDELERIAKSN